MTPTESSTSSTTSTVSSITPAESSTLAPSLTASSATLTDTSASVTTSRSSFTPPTDISTSATISTASFAPPTDISTSATTSTASFTPPTDTSTTTTTSTASFTPPTDTSTTTTTSTTVSTTPTYTSTSATTSRTSSTTSTSITTTKAITTSPVINGCQLCPYGYRQSDTVLYGSDDGYWQYYLPQNIMFGTQTYSSIFVNVNGFVTFDQGYVSWTPVRFPFYNYYNTYYSYAYMYNYYFYNLPLLAIFWADVDVRVGPGRIFYHSYSRNYYNSYVPMAHQAVFDYVANHIRTDAGDYGFWPSMVVVITWENVSPFPAEYNLGERATFQMILASDYRYYQTYAIFNYKEFNWLTSRNNGEGYQWNVYNYKNLFTSGSPSAYQLPRIRGERGSVCKWTLPVSTGFSYQLSPEFKCHQWHWSQSSNPSTTWVINNRWWALPSCPCSLWQVLWDPRFIFDYSTGCATAFSSIYGTYTQRCCYNFYGYYYYYYYYYYWWWWWTPNWSLGYGFLDTSWSFNSGSMLQYNPYYYYYLYYENDYLPKRWCCLESNNCGLYHQVRPKDYCYNYFMPWFGFMFGEPHINTVDGATYTFNGWGEYWLMKAEGTAFVQGRTDRAAGAGGSPANATVFVAFAAISFATSTVDNVTTDVVSDRVFFGLNDAKTEMIVRINDDLDLTPWFSSAKDGAVNIDFLGVVFTKRNTTLEARFSNGISLQVQYGYKSLLLSATVPPDLQGNAPFQGLMGNIDGKADNDLLNANGTTLPPGSAEDEIFYDFGQTWLVQKAVDTLFYYNTSRNETFESFQHPDFVPTFGTENADPALVSKADSYCTSNGVVDQSCRYDYIVSGGNKDLARNSLTASSDYQATARDLSRSIVKIYVENSLTNWTVNVSDSVYISVSSTNSSNSLYLETASNANGIQLSSFNSSTWRFTWTPHDTNEVNFTFNANDSSGSIARPLTLTVRLCACVNNGSCEWDTLQSDYNNTDTFQIVACSCQKELYEGPFCENFFNACLAEPCGPNRNCSLLYPGFHCGDCLEGFEVSGYKCADIDECMLTNANHSVCDPVTEVCVNLDGGYNCTCQSGFEKSGSVCQNIDECLLRLDNCTQLCNDTFGGFVCGCIDGFSLLSDGASCAGNSTANCTCDYCSATVPCGCSRGYEQINNSCVDIDECRSTKNPCGVGTNSTCSNTAGNYDCSCPAGYTLRGNRFCEQCDPGWWGLNCSTVCQCDASNCTHAHGCLRCANSGFTGPDCDVDVDECRSGSESICPKNSQCNNTFGSYLCVCKDWYEAVLDQCMLLDACIYDHSNVRLVQNENVTRCLHSGHCKNGSVAAGDFACDCEPGYTGVRCETNIDECASIPCWYEGQCIDQVNGYSCNCTENHYGSYCQYNASVIIAVLPETPEVTTFTEAISETTSGTTLTISGSPVTIQTPTISAVPASQPTAGSPKTTQTGVASTPAPSQPTSGTHTENAESAVTQSNAGATNSSTASSSSTSASTRSSSTKSSTSSSTVPTTTTESVVSRILIPSLSAVLGVTLAAVLGIGGYFLMSRFCPLTVPAGAVRTTPISDSSPVFSQFPNSRFPQPTRRVWYPSYGMDVEAPPLYPRPPPPRLYRPEPALVRWTYRNPETADMPVRWSVLRNFQNNRGPTYNYRTRPNSYGDYRLGPSSYDYY